MRFGGLCISLGLAAMVWAGLAAAQAPGKSLRPVARPGSVSLPQAQVAPESAQPAVSPAVVVRPRARPTETVRADPPTEPPRSAGRDQDNAPAAPVTRQRLGEGDGRQARQQPAAQPTGQVGQQAGERGGIFKSLRPLLRPRAVRREAAARRKQQARGAVCGDLAIQGQEIGAVPGRIGGCGIESAVKVRSISGVGLSMQSVMDCTTAKSLKNWIDRGMKPAVGNRGGGVASIRVAAHYACRTRNNQRGAKISEHGKGRAIDIAGFTLNDGSKITVLTDWGKGRNGQILRRMHQTACGPFGTVLGPASNKYHRDHFHFDTARYRSGSYCR